MNGRRLLATATLLASMFVVGGALAASPASACDINNHCYGQTQSSGSSVVGLQARISPSCLSASSGTFTTDEIWVVSDDGHWVEDGFLVDNYVSINGLPSTGKVQFWGDSTPSHGFHGHVIKNNTSLAATTFTIYESGVDKYTVKAGSYSSASTGNAMNPFAGIYGSEDSANSGPHSYAYFYDTKYLIGATWHNGTDSTSYTHNSPETFSWGSLGSAFYAGVPC